MDQLDRRLLPGSPHRRVWVYAVLAGCLAASVCTVNLGEPLLRSDEGTYAMVTDGILRSGQWLVPQINNRPYLNKPPLYLWMAAASRQVFDDIELGQRAPAAVCAVLTVVCLCVLGGRWLGPEYGLAAAVVLLLHERLILWSTHAFRQGTMESSVTLLATLCVLVSGWRRDDGARLGPWLWIGLACGAMSMLKPLVGFGFFAVVAAERLVAHRRAGRWRRDLRPMAAGLGAGLLVWAPWHALVIARYPSRLLLAKLDQQVVDRVVAGIPAHTEGPFYYLVEITTSSRLFWPFIAVVILAFVPRFAAEKGPELRRLAFITVAWVGLLSLSTSKLLWYVFPVFPLIALLVVAGAARAWRLWSPLAGRWRPPPLVRDALVVVLVLIGGLAMTRAAALKSAFLADRLHSLPWSLYVTMSTERGAAPEVVVVGEEQRQRGYYGWRMGTRAVAHVDDLLALPVAEPALVIPSQSLAVGERERLGSALEGRGATRFDDQRGTVWVVTGPSGGRRPG